MLPFCVAILFVACRKANTSEEKPVKVEVEECAVKTFSNEQVTLCFDSLVQDSRCPANAVCIWQGVAQARLSFTVNNQHHQFVLSTNKALPGAITDTTIHNYIITLVNIHPYPGDGQTITPYAELLLKRL